MSELFSPIPGKRPILPSVRHASGAAPGSEFTGSGADGRLDHFAHDLGAEPAGFFYPDGGFQLADLFSGCGTTVLLASARTIASAVGRFPLAAKYENRPAKVCPD
jgi:hypothetical protein